MIKWVQNALKSSNDRVGKKNRPTYSQIFSGTKQDRDKPFFSTERGDQVGHKIKTQWDQNMSKRGQLHKSSLPHSNIEVPFPSRNNINNGSLA